MKFRFATCQRWRIYLLCLYHEIHFIYIFTSARSSMIRMIINELKGDELSCTRAIRCTRLREARRIIEHVSGEIAWTLSSVTINRKARMDFPLRKENASGLWRFIRYTSIHDISTLHDSSVPIFWSPCKRRFVSFGRCWKSISFPTNVSLCAFFLRFVSLREQRVMNWKVQVR